MSVEDHPLIAVADGARHVALAALAETGPVHRITLPPDTPAWLITGFDEARAVLTDARVVKAGAESTPTLRALPREVATGLHHHMLTKNPPDHTRLRRLVSMAFTRRRIEAMEPQIQRICAELLDDVVKRLDSGETVDLMTSFAYPLPIRVICELLGIAPGDHGRMREWTRVVLADSAVDFDHFVASSQELLAFLQEQVAAKRRAPGDDLLSALAGARDGDDRLSEDELTSMAALLILAGHETTVNQIGNAVAGLLTHPEQLVRLRAEPDRMAAAFEEALRHDSATQVTIPAVTAAEVEVADTVIPAGELLLVSLLAANRDARRFPAPAALDITRSGDTHIAFGHGIHHCLGAPLARLEGQIALKALLDAVPDLELAARADRLERVPSLLINGLVSLPVRRRVD